jgi:hypothetical protein
VHKLIQTGRLEATPQIGIVGYDVSPDSVEEYRQAQKEEGRPEAA